MVCALNCTGITCAKCSSMAVLDCSGTSALPLHAATVHEVLSSCSCAEDCCEDGAWVVLHSKDRSMSFCLWNRSTTDAWLVCRLCCCAVALWLDSDSYTLQLSQNTASITSWFTGSSSYTPPPWLVLFIRLCFSKFPFFSMACWDSHADMHTC